MMSKGERVFWMMMLIVMLTAMQILPPGLALPSAFEKGGSANGREELESMLSGEHRGSGYSDVDDAYSAPSLALIRPEYDNPYKNAFRNDTIFSGFVREFNDNSASQNNRTWTDILLNASSLLDLNSTSNASMEAVSSIQS
ncbi:MAG: hypothetical protein NTV25_07515 [Methanothrix sp.]|nr:hypothetical protein [Methanothrix sp.]